MENKEYEMFKERIVLVVCFAGSDRSKMVAEVLNKWGYIASNRGVNKNYNQVTSEDLRGIGSIIFTSPTIKDLFEEDEDLNRTLKINNIPVKVMNLTESDKERALQLDKIAQFKDKISK